MTDTLFVLVALLTVLLGALAVAAFVSDVLMKRIRDVSKR